MTVLNLRTVNLYTYGYNHRRPLEESDYHGRRFQLYISCQQRLDYLNDQAE